MKNRTIAIINEIENKTSNIDELCDVFKKYNVSDKIYVFTQKDETKFNQKSGNVEFIGVKIPADKDTRPKAKNFVIKYFKNNNYDGILHVIEDIIEILHDPTKFINDIENMMDVYGLNNWFSTMTDGCNYVYSKYTPRLNIVIDKPEYQKLNINNAVFCSHSNTQWIVYNLGKADDNELYFIEDFKIDMFWIIEFLARRRNTHPNSLYYMNQYYTCASENGLFRLKSTCKRDNFDQKPLMAEEDQKFKSMNINYAPDNNIDAVLEKLYATLNDKL